MPGSFHSYFVVAFDLDQRNQPIPAFPVRQAASNGEAIAAAKALAETHAGALAWERQSDPVVGEESEPLVIFQAGRIGDFN